LDLPPQVKIVPNVSGLLGGIALWRDWINFVVQMPINIKETGFSCPH
jgi:hypothetical protein